MSIKKVSHPRTFPRLHPGLEQRLREAEEAERRGETPRQIDGAQKVTRPTPEVGSQDRAQQVRTLGLVDPAYRQAVDGLAALAAQEPFRPGSDLDTIWDDLSEAEKIQAGATERFRLELDNAVRLALGGFRAPHEIGGILDHRALKRSTENLQALADVLAYILAPDSLALLRRFIDETMDLLLLCLRKRVVRGLDGARAYNLVEDLVHKLIYQELTSRQRAMGDRGIRRICANIDLADQIYAEMMRNPGFNPRVRLLTRLIQVHQDLGHTAYAARVSYRGAKLHRAYGVRILTDEIERYRTLLPPREIELFRTAVATHTSEEFPFATSFVLGVIRAVDHLAPFGPHRVYRHLEGLRGAEDYLGDLLDRARSQEFERYAAAKNLFAEFLQQQGLGDPLRDDIMAAFRPIEREAFPIELGDIAGEITEVSFDTNGQGAVRVTLGPDDFAQTYQTLFDYQQEQFSRMLERLFIELEQFSKENALTLQRPGHGALYISKAAGATPDPAKTS